MKIMSIAGARPNFMKLASIARAVKSYNQELTKSEHANPNKVDHIIVHTGQHYDDKMSKSFFDEGHQVSFPATEDCLCIV